MATLVLVRHGESEWNLKGLWTGFTDVNLTEKGIEEAKNAGNTIKDIHFDAAFTSNLKRAHQTLDEILLIINQTSIPITKEFALNERDYGDLTGQNKWKIKEQYGEEQFLKWRRSWDFPIPNGESLKDVYARVVPYYQTHIEPLLKEGKNILIAAHGNSLRALIKYLDHIPDEEISQLEFGTGGVYVYTIDDKGVVKDKKSLVVNTTVA